MKTLKQILVVGVIIFGLHFTYAFGCVTSEQANANLTNYYNQLSVQNTKIEDAKAQLEIYQKILTQINSINTNSRSYADYANSMVLKGTSYYVVKTNSNTALTFSQQVIKNFALYKEEIEGKIIETKNIIDNQPQISQPDTDVCPTKVIYVPVVQPVITKPQVPTQTIAPVIKKVIKKKQIIFNCPIILWTCWNKYKNL